MSGGLSVAAWLRWSSRTVTDLVRATGAQDEAEVKLAYPDLCRELREWVGSGYHTVPATAGRFVRATETIANMTSDEDQALGGPLESGSEIINHILKQYLPRQDLPLIRDVERLESAVSASEDSILVTGIVRLRVALGVMPAARKAG